MTERPLWEYFMQLKPIKWFCNLKICRKAMKIPIMQKLFNCETVTYLFYGTAATVINWGLYWFFCFLFRIPINNPSSDDAVLSFIANSIAFILALIFAFFTNKFIVFKSKGNGIKKSIGEFISFTFARLFTFILESLILTISNYLHLNLIIMKIVAGIIVIILNYVFSKLFIFNHKDKGVK